MLAYKNVIIFGTGVCYQNYKELVFSKSTVLCLSDNNKAKWETSLDGISILPPDKIHSFDFDRIVLLVSYPTAVEIKTQLIQLGIPECKILFYDEYIAHVCRGEQICFEAKHIKIAIISRKLDYSGSSVAILNASIALNTAGYLVTLIVPQCDRRFAREFNCHGVSIIECPSIICMENTELRLIDSFDFVIVNVLPTIDAVFKVFGYKPLLWWIHEPSEKYSNLYKSVSARYPQYLSDKRIQSIPVYAVSTIAKNPFLRHFSKAKVDILPYCLVDEGNLSVQNNKCATISFALIAGFSELKQQHLYLQAAAKLVETHTNCRFLLIGNLGNSAYSQKVLALAKSMPSVELRGVLTREQMLAAYQNEIDVVVCPSLEECLPTVIAEGMMHSKLCIVSDNTGMADYITDGENGFICKAGSLESLYEKMVYCAEHFGELDSVRKNARKTYEENFTMDIFAKRIDRIIKDSLKNMGGTAV